MALSDDSCPSVSLGEQTLYRCPECGSLVDSPTWRCWHGPTDEIGRDRVPVRVTVEEVKS